MSRLEPSKRCSREGRAETGESGERASPGRTEGHARITRNVALEAARRSRPTSKAIRLAIGPSMATMAVEPRSDGIAGVAIDHQGLPHSAAVDRWKAHWAEWLTALDDA